MSATSHGPADLLSPPSYDVFLETGAKIQPWVFAEAEWRRAKTSLVRSAQRDARPTGANRADADAAIAAMDDLLAFARPRLERREEPKP